MVSFIEMNGFYYAVLWIRDIWFGSGSAEDLYRWLMDPGPHPAFFVYGWQSKLFFQSFFAYTSVFKDKKSKRSYKIVKSRFFYFSAKLMVSTVRYVGFYGFYELFVLWGQEAPIPVGAWGVGRRGCGGWGNTLEETHAFLVLPDFVPSPLSCQPAKARCTWNTERRKTKRVARKVLLWGGGTGAK